MIEPAADVAIRLSSISKKYRLFRSRRERLLEALHPLRRVYHTEFWALRDVNLTVNRGRTVGILGVNGSGKSTLLQVISSVLKPTTGVCEVNGRVAALLELGAGFHPEMTGRENVLTNAMIMGLSSERMEDRINEVREFADIGEFFDQPVKTYSSGMFMRVAFATAINVDPDILIIDEALAVGDAKFQEKCFRKFRSFRDAGKTILYVTHDRASVTNFCDEAVLMHAGRVVEVGEPTWIVDRFTEVMTTGKLRPINRAASVGNSSAFEAGATPRPETVSSTIVSEVDKLHHEGASLALRSFLLGNQDQEGDLCPRNPLYNKNEVRFGGGGAEIIDFLLMEGQKVNPGTVPSGAVVDIYVKVHFSESFDMPLVGIAISNEQGVVIYGTHSGWRGCNLAPAKPGDTRVFRFQFPFSVSAGHCFVELGVARGEEQVNDVRSRLIYMYISRQEVMMGLADFRASIDEISVPSQSAMS